MSDRRRVVVTGLGIASAIGVDEKTVWNNLISGQGGIDHLQSLDTTETKAKIGAEVDRPAVAARLKRLGRRAVDRALDLTMVAAADALHQAKLVGEPPHEPQNVSVILGTGVGSAESHYTAFSAFFEKGVRGLRPTCVPRMMYNAISSGLSIHFRLTGPNYMVVSSCTSSTNAIGLAYRTIRDGYADTVVCGGGDGFFDPFFFGVWNNLGVLSVNPDPKTACRPFSVDRDGCVLGEGAGILVLESRDHALERGINLRGEIVGYGESSDAAHRTKPNVAGQVAAMQGALSDAGVEPESLGFINAHGTATKANDLVESQSLCQVLGSAAGRVPVVANKSFFGHTLGASGALETIASLLALEKGIAPPNLNLGKVDPECGPICLVGDQPQTIESPLAMKNSFGFGGGNGVLVLKRTD